jgi:hypothetical protein
MTVLLECRHLSNVLMAVVVVMSIDVVALMHTIARVVAAIAVVTVVAAMAVVTLVRARASSYLFLIDLRVAKFARSVPPFRASVLLCGSYAVKRRLAMTSAQRPVRRSLPHWNVVRPRRCQLSQHFRFGSSLSRRRS